MRNAELEVLEQNKAPPTLFDERACAAFALADEVLVNSRAADQTFAMARNLLSPREVIELLLLIGYFRMIGGMMTTLRSKSTFHSARKYQQRSAILPAIKIYSITSSEGRMQCSS